MRQLLKLTLIATALFAVLISAASAEEFTDPSAGFSFTTPTGWKTQETPDVVSYVAANEVSQVNITKESADGVTLDDFVRSFAGELKASLTKFKLISSGKVKIDGANAGFWIYKAKIEGVSLQFKSYVIFKDESMYNIVFCTTPQLYKTDVAGVDTIIRTWSWSVN